MTPHESVAPETTRATHTGSAASTDTGKATWRPSAAITTRWWLPAGVPEGSVTVVRTVPDASAVRPVARTTGSECSSRRMPVSFGWKPLATIVTDWPAVTEPPARTPSTASTGAVVGAGAGVGRRPPGDAAANVIGPETASRLRSYPEQPCAQKTAAT